MQLPAASEAVKAPEPADVATKPAVALVSTTAESPVTSPVEQTKDAADILQQDVPKHMGAAKHVQHVKVAFFPTSPLCCASAELQKLRLGH